MKKTWIKIKRGLLTAEHREKLGVRVWLYLYILDRADWETGIVYGWKDKDEAEDFDMSWRTLQQQRQQLERDGYITCQQNFQSQDIVIHNWINPREYSGDQYNPRYGGTEDYVPEDESTQSRVPSEHGTNHGTNHGLSKPSTPTLSSHITGQEEQPPDFESMELPEIRRIPEIAIYIKVTERIPGKYQYKVIWETVRKHQFTAEYLEPFWQEWAGNRGYRPGNNGWLTDWAVKGEIPDGRPGNNKDQTIQDKLEREGYEYRRAS